MKVFPLIAENENLVELFSLMLPVSEIMKQAQLTTFPARIDGFLALCRLNRHLLNSEEPLEIYDPSREDYEAPNRQPMTRDPLHLCNLTKHTRVLLSNALQKRFYKSYNGTPRSSMLEMQVFMHLVHRKLNCLGYILEPFDAEKHRNRIMDEIVDLCIKCEQAQNGGVEEGERQSIHGDKSIVLESQGVDKTKNFNNLWDFEEFACDDTPVEESLSTAEESVRAEINSYLDHERALPGDVTSRNLLNWWRTKGSKYPSLSVVARAVLGHPVSSARIDRDFGTAGSFLSSRRTRHDSAFVDMLLFLHCNLDLIPSDVPEMSNPEWKSQIPARLLVGSGNTDPLLNIAMNENEDFDFGLLQYL
ncbi:hypothetical protein BWQ96_10224 [Gracilariopsis chorda]|uniref:HAT C-terminal dimerisation domain-containing protein n=1 Tax=Gracilariopsis chorda TaxID=448386 RepID=A0A2V3IDA5_9FLOR|nr:hypothetical protein BWQ96_10224 [Gracilariopsis chorda]|eukprot:PXF40066.1 hypothetical protein BWQ96_10224 [Gracilariopsis chorda]